MRTEVCLTIDTEFSIAGAFADPVNRRPVGEARVYCPAQGEDCGLPFILRTLARFAVPATFFVETLNTAYFGDAPMRRIAETIVAAGQDAQLHLHPCCIFVNRIGPITSIAIRPTTIAPADRWTKWPRSSRPVSSPSGVGA